MPPLGSGWRQPNRPTGRSSGRCASSNNARVQWPNCVSASSATHSPPAAINTALDRLRDLDLLDDAAFSRSWIENRRAFRPRGSLALRDELRRKGVARDLIDAALAEADGDDPDAAAEEEMTRALDLARRALPRYANAPDRATFQRRMGGYLQRKGFSLATIRPILQELWQPTHDDDDPDSEPVL